jgi:hypothetical protein
MAGPVSAQDPRLERARRTGRRVGLGIFIALVSAFTLVCSMQIILQVWWPARPATSLECRPGVGRLFGALQRARSAAAAAVGGERTVLGSFRAALQPEWELQPSLTDRCRGDAPAARALAALEELRYAEEFSLRSESTDVAAQRRRVAALLDEIGVAPAEASGAEHLR